MGRKKRLPPAYGGLVPLLTFQREMQRDPLRYLRGATGMVGNTVLRERVTLAHWPMRMVLTLCPDDLSEISTSQNFVRPSLVRRIMKPILGNESIFTTDGPNHLVQRRKLGPQLGGTNLKAMMDNIYTRILATINKWPTGKPVDLLELCNFLVLDILDVVVFGSSGLRGLDADLLDGLNFLFEESARGFQNPLSHLFLRNFPLTERSRRYIYEERRLHDLVQSLIKHGDISASGLVGALLKDRQNGQELPDNLIESLALSTVFAGHVTTASMAASTFWLLSGNAEWLARTRECGNYLLTSGASANLAKDSRFRDLKLVLKESLRLYPPNWLNMRSTADWTELGPYLLPPKTNVLFSSFLSHRDPRYWNRPEQFAPERFDSGEPAKWNYYPFWHDTQNCLGERLALLEGSYIIGLALALFNIRVIDPASVRMHASTGLSPKNLRVILTRR